jgi:hypothetical protein
MSQISDEFSNGDRRCPFIALWMLQVPANRRKARHKAKAKISQSLFGKVRDPATARKEMQRAATVSFSAC